MWTTLLLHTSVFVVNWSAEERIKHCKDGKREDDSTCMANRPDQFQTREKFARHLQKVYEYLDRAGA